MVRGITVHNIENFSNYNEALKRLDNQLIIANYRKLKAERDGDKIFFYKRGKSFGYVTDNHPVYEVNIEELNPAEAEAIMVAYFGRCDVEYDFKLTSTIGERVYVCEPLIKEDKSGFIFDIESVYCGKVIRVYGNNHVYPVVDVQVEHGDRIKIIERIPSCMIFKNILNLVEAYNRGENGYTNVNDFCNKCRDLINYTHELWFGYAYKSEVSFDLIKGYKTSKKTYTYGIEYDTDVEKAITRTMPNAINEYTNEVYSIITECRADSVSKDEYGRDLINISINNQGVTLRREEVKVAFEINKIEENYH